MAERIKDYKKLKDECIEWIQRWFEENGKGCNAIVGISGGKDSTIVAKLCVEALGSNRVIGISLPGVGQDNKCAIEVAETLGIQLRTIHLGNLLNQTMNTAGFEPSKNSELNLPARFRMMMLYYVAQSFNGRVIGTCNESENYIGYFTKFGDGVSDMEPLANLTVTEVKKLGYELGLPKHLVDKTPDDGLPNSRPDEEKIGFTYEQLDNYICNEENKIPIDVKKKIEEMHKNSYFKTKITEMIDSFEPIDVLTFKYRDLEEFDEFINLIEEK